jgi:Lysine-specific metallo-endopeptidase
VNDYDTLIQYIRSKLPLAVTPGVSYRDLQVYFDQKLINPLNERGDVKVMARRALTVAGLDERLSTNASTLAQPGNEKTRAVAATLLAMSIVRDDRDAELIKGRNRLSRMNTPMVESELLSILKRGDVIDSIRFPQLQLKDFGSAGSRANLWKTQTEDAFQLATDLLEKCEQQFLVGANRPLKPGIASAFRDYFGNPAALIDTATVLFNNNPNHFGGRPVWTPPDKSHLEVVQGVMRRACQNFLRKKVLIPFGGPRIDSGTKAYAPGKINPTRIHISGRFFGQPPKGLGSMGGTLVHECTHAFARTCDHKYGSDDCKALALADLTKALSNADNYRFFVEAAFG